MKILQWAFWTYLACSEILKILYVVTCDCQSAAFSSWFYPAFQHSPYSYWGLWHGVTFLAGPYSLAWWILNSPAIFGYWIFNSYILLLDLIVLVFIARRWKLYAVYYATVSVWFAATLDPVDFFPFLFTMLGVFAWPFLLLAIVVKLPFGAPFWVWQWVATNPNSAQGPENYGRYLIISGLWIISLSINIWQKHKRAYGTAQLNIRTEGRTVSGRLASETESDTESDQGS